MHKPNTNQQVSIETGIIQLCSSATIIAENSLALENNKDNVSPEKRLPYIWSSYVMGTKIYLALKHPNAIKITQEIEYHIKTIENIFCLSLPNSQLSRLNNAKVLINPNNLLVELLEKSREIYFKTGGVFNILKPSHEINPIVSNDNKKFNLQTHKITPLSGNFMHNLYVSSKKIMLQKDFVVDIKAIAKGFIIDTISALLIQNELRTGFVEIEDYLMIGRKQKDTPFYHNSLKEMEKKLKPTCLHTYKANAKLNEFCILSEVADMSATMPRLYSYPISVTAHNATLASAVLFSLSKANVIERKIILDNYKNIDIKFG